MIEADDDLIIAICQIWEEILLVKIKNLDQDFFDLGGDSIMAYRIAFLLSKKLKINIGMDIIFQYPAISDLYLEIKNHLTCSSSDFT